MFKVERTSNPTHPITLTASSGKEVIRLHVLTEEVAGELIRDLQAAVYNASAPVFTPDQVDFVRQIARSEVSFTLRDAANATRER